MTEWYELYEKIVPYIVCIETPKSAGTGFLFALNESKSVVAFATAAHVVQYADAWKLPIKLRHHVSEEEIFVPDSKRFIEIDQKRDSASIIIANPGAYLPEDPLKMVEPNEFWKMGVQVAWVGYPSIAYPNLCLFTGSIAAFVQEDDSYLIDGVAINGVSGGPVFTSLPDNQIEVLGTISAYMPNRQYGDALPGLLQAHDVTAHQKIVRAIRSVDDARKNREAQGKGSRPKVMPSVIPPSGMIGSQ